MIGTLTQGHELPVVAPAAILRGVGRIDFDKLASSFFRFDAQLSKEGRPRGVCNAFSQTMSMGHAVDVDGHHAVGQLLAGRRGEVEPRLRVVRVALQPRRAVCDHLPLALVQAPLHKALVGPCQRSLVITIR